jgi:small subunit ribosomal protein S1
MSKELIHPEQFSKVPTSVAMTDEALQLNDEQRKELAELCEGVFGNFKQGNVVKGRIVKIDSDGVLVDIGYKSDGLIPRYEFGEHELKRLIPGNEIEVLIDELESIDGNVILSYEKARALKAWDSITQYFEENKPIEGIVTHKVKGGLSVDIGIPAFLPGSQIDLQKVMDFDQYLGQSITANIIKINKKRGNVIISRRKYLSDQRSDVRRKVLDTLAEGQIINGVVKNITNYGAFVDIGGVDGLLHITDMTWGRIGHPSEIIKIGDTIAVKVLSFDKDHEKISLGLKQLIDNPWETLGAEFQANSQVKGIISSITNYGLFVEVAKGVEGLVHISEISWTDRINDLKDKYKVGDEIDVYIVSIDKENRRMSLSVKRLEKNPWESIGEQFKVGQKIKGKISNITDFGIFVELLPGVDGLAHISDLSWTEHIDHPADIYKKGQEVEAVVLSVDPEKKKVSLGIKQLTQDPWESIEKEYPVGSVIEGEVSRITNFGAFIRLPIGVEGLVHISELSDQNVEKVEDVLKLGDKRQFRVINVNRNERRLGLSLRQPREDKKAEASAVEVAKAPEKKVRAAKTQKVEQQPVVKPRSLFQIELEKHVARQQEAMTDEESEETESSKE